MNHSVKFGFRHDSIEKYRVANIAFDQPGLWRNRPRKSRRQVIDDDHILTVFQQLGHWGAMAKSNYAGLRFREPVYRTIRELALSYFEHYYNVAGEKTLRAYSRPVNLRRFDKLNWMTSEDDLWEVCEYLCVIPHTRVMPPPLERKRRKMDRRLYAAGMVGMSYAHSK